MKSGEDLWISSKVVLETYMQVPETLSCSHHNAERNFHIITYLLVLTIVSLITTLAYTFPLSYNVMQVHFTQRRLQKTNKQTKIVEI